MSRSVAFPRAAIASLFICASAILGFQRDAGNGFLSVDFAVFDSQGAPVTSLPRENFVPTEGGIVRDIANLLPPDTPWHILFVFDRALVRSHSDGGMVDRWNEATTAVSQFAASLGSNDRISVVLFDDRIETIVDRQPVREGIGALMASNPASGPPTESKDVYGMIERVVTRTTTESKAFRNAIIVLTDGADARLSPRFFGKDPVPSGIYAAIVDPLFGLPDEKEQQDFRHAIEIVAASGTRLFFMVVDGESLAISRIFPGFQRAGDGYAAGIRDRAERLANASGGTVIYRKTPKDAIEHYAESCRDLALKLRYTMQISKPSPRVAAGRIDVSTRTAGFRVQLFGTPRSKDGLQ